MQDNVGAHVTALIQEDIHLHLFIHLFCYLFTPIVRIGALILLYPLINYVDIIMPLQ